MSCSWCKSDNGMYTDEDGEQWPCIHCRPMGAPMKAQKIKGGNCAVIAVILVGGVAAAAVGVVEAIRHLV